MMGNPIQLQEAAGSNLRLHSGLPDILSVFSTLHSNEYQHDTPSVSSICDDIHQD